jgi:hypothetical protein
LGAYHTSWFSYAAVDDLDFWVTSLGQVALDKDFIDFLTDGKYIVKYERSFINEHCLEMELIFLQKVLTDFKIVPILLSEADSFLIEKLAEKIADKKTIKAILLGEKIDEKTLGKSFFLQTFDISLDFSRLLGYTAIGGCLRQNKNDEKFFWMRRRKKKP